MIFIRVSEASSDFVMYYIFPPATDEVPVTKSPSTTTVTTVAQTKGDNIKQIPAF